MQFVLLLVLSALTMAMTGAWAVRASSTRVRFAPCGYRMIRRRKPAAVLANALGIGAFGGLALALLCVALTQ